MKLWNSQAIFPWSPNQQLYIYNSLGKIKASIDYNPELRFFNDHTHEADKFVVWCREPQLAT